MEKDNYNKGYEIERYVMDELRKREFEVCYEDTYFDITAKKYDRLRKIEIKSCNFLIKNGGGKTYYGRFDFTNPKNCSLQRSNNVDICFVLNVKGTYEIIGFISSKTLWNRFHKKRYVFLKDLFNLRLKRINEYQNYFFHKNC